MAQKKKQAENKIIKPGKDIIMSRADTLKKKLLKIAAQQAVDMVMDFSGVKTIDAIGLGVIIAFRNTLKKKGGNLTLKNVPEEIADFFEALRLDRDIEIVPAG